MVVKRLLAIALLVAAIGASAPAAGAAPTDTQFTIASHAEYVSPTTVAVKVTLNCDPYVYDDSPALLGYVYVSLRSEETGGIGAGFTVVPCTGETETAVVLVSGGPFVPGPALATGSGCGFTCDSDTRRIQIVL